MSLRDVGFLVVGFLCGFVCCIVNLAKFRADTIKYKKIARILNADDPKSYR